MIGYVYGGAVGHDVYVFKKDPSTGWTNFPERKLIDNTNGGCFGCSISLKGSKVVVGAWNGNNGAYIYDLDELANLNYQVILSPYGTSLGPFGVSVAQGEDILLISNDGGDMFDTAGVSLLPLLASFLHPRVFYH